jgi:hypothetical protein
MPCVTGEGIGLCGEHIQTDKHLPPSTFTGQFLRKGVFIDIWSTGEGGCLKWALIHKF